MLPFFTVLVSFLLLLRVAESSVFELDGNKFLERRGPNEAWLVVFYAEWCGHCQKLMPAFERVSARLRGTPIRTGKIESNRAGSAARHYQVNGYPSVVYVHGDSWHSFDGARNEESLYKFALRSYGPTLKYFDTAKRFEELVRLHELDSFFLLFCDAESCLRHGVTQLPAAYVNVSNVMQLRADFYYATRMVFASLFRDSLFDNADGAATLVQSTEPTDLEYEASGEKSAVRFGSGPIMQYERGVLPLSVGDRILWVDRASCEPVLLAATGNVDEVLIVVKDGSLFCFDQHAELRRQRERAAAREEASSGSSVDQQADVEAASGSTDGSQAEGEEKDNVQKQSDDEGLEALVGRWVNSERFVCFAPIGGVEVNELATTGKKLALFVTLNATSLGDSNLDPARLSAFFYQAGRTLSTRRASYHSRYQFAWLTDPETVHLMILARPSVPFMFVFDSVTHYFYLNDTRQQQTEWRSTREFASFLSEVDAGSIAARGGRGWLNRMARALFDLYISFVDLLFGAPLVALLVLGLPLGVLSILVYALCCLDSDAQPAIDPDELEREFGDSDYDEADLDAASEEPELDEADGVADADSAILRHRPTVNSEHNPQSDFRTTPSSKKTA